MAENNFIIELIARLNKSASKKQVQTDVKNLGKIKIPLIGTLNKRQTRQQIKQDLDSLNETVNITGKVDKNGVVKSVQQATQQAQKNIQAKPIEINFSVKKDKLINDIKLLGKQNSRLFKDAGMASKYSTLLDNAQLATSTQELNNLRIQLGAFRSEIKVAGKTGMTFIDALKSGLSKVLQLFGGYNIVMQFTRQLRNAWKEARELDSALTDLSRVNSEISRNDFPDYLDRVINKTKQLAIATKDYIDAVTTFSRAGYNLTDSETLADMAVQLEKVGDMSATDASKALLSGLQGYAEIDGYGMDQLIEKAQALNDKIDIIGNTASISQKEVAEGIQAVGSVMSDANTSVDEFLSLLAAGNRAVQDSNKVALAIRTSALRIRGCTVELQEMGEETEDVIESTSTLAAKIKALTNIDGSGGVNILEADEETFRSIYDIYNDIAKVYDQMSDTDSSALLDLIAGKNRSNQISAILQNMSEANELLDRSLNAAGTASNEYQIYLNSTEAATERFGVAMTETYNNILNGDTVKSLANAATAVLNFANSLGIIEGTLKGFLALGILKGITTLTVAFKNSALQVSNYGKALNTVKDMSVMTAGTIEYTESMNTLRASCMGLTEVQLRQVLANKALGESERVAILMERGLTETQAQAKLVQMGLTQTTKAQAAANGAATASTFSLKAAITGLGASIKAAFLSNPIGIVIMAISTAIGLATSAISKHNQAVEEARQRAKEAADEANTLGDEIADLTNKYISLSEAVRTDTSAKKDLMATQTELLKKLGLEGKNIDDLIAKYGSLSNAIRQASIDSLKNSQIDLIAGVNAAREELLDVAKDNFWGTNNIINATGEDAVKAFKELEKAGIVNSGSYGSAGGSLVLIGDDTVDGALENFKRLEDAVNALRESEAFTAQELSENSLFQAIYGRYSEMKNGVEEYRSAIGDLNENLSQQTMLTALQGQEIPKTEEAFNTFRQELVDTAVVSKQFIGNEKEITDAINNYLSTVPEFEGYYSIPLENELDKVNALLEQENFSTFDLTTYKDQIDDFQSKVKTLGDALSSIRSGKFEDSDLTDLLQEFPELTDKSEDLEAALVELLNNSLTVLFDTLGDEVPDSLKVSLQELTDIASGAAVHLNDAFSSIHSSWDVLQDFKDVMASGFDDNITNSLLQSVRNLNGELETLVAGYYSGIVTAEELYEALTKHYENDLQNYSEALIKKNDLNTDFYNAVGMASEEVINQFMDDYGVDLENCKSYNEAKLEIEKQTLGQISSIWSQYYDAQSKTLKVSMSEIEARAAHGGGDASAFLEQYKLIENYEAAMEALNNITYNGIKTNFESISSKLNTNSSSSSKSSSTESTKEFSEELNWVEKLVNKVSSALDKLKDKVSNTYIGWSVRNHSLTKAMEKTNEAISVQQQAYEQYMQKAASVGLSQEYVNKIQNGSLNIEDITDESLADRIKEYETWYDKATDCSDAIEELKTQLADMAKQKFDNINTYFEGLMETTQKSISKLETKEKNTFKAPKARVYNGLYDETQNLINYNTQRVQQLEEALDSAVNSGYIESGSEAWRDMYNEILEVRNATEEYKLELQDISKRRYEALLKPIEQELAQQEQRKNVIENIQDRLALQGYVEAKGLYERQLRDSESRLQTLKEEATQLQQNMQDAISKGMEVGSDDWIDMKSAIDDNVISVMELENSMIELNNAIRDLEWSKFDRLQKSISRITGESDFMIDMYSKDDTYDEDGKLTAEGSAVIGLHAQNYFAYKEQARAYKDEVDKINKELAADPTNTTLIDRKNDLIDAYQNATKAAYDEYEAVIELGKEGYQAQIDSIQELIDAKKKQLEADKSLYEYQKSIAEKTKNIADIQKQLSALANDDSEENQAKIQQLKVDLTDAQKDLEDAQYDKWYNDQQDMLDRLAEEYAALISEQSQNEQEVFQEMIEYVNSNAQAIQDTISSKAQEWDYVFSYGIDSVLEPGISGITDIGQNIYEEIQRLYALNERMYRVSADLADLGVTDYGLETTISDETTARNFIERLYNGLLGRQSDESGLNFWMDKLMNGATVQEMLEGFLNSDEYKAMNKSPEDTILDFYRGLLGREAETEGFNHWMEQYRNGMSLSEIGTHGFLDSDEFLSRDHWLNLLDTKQVLPNTAEKGTKVEFVPVDMREYIAELRAKSAVANGISVEELKPIPQDLSTIFNLKNAPQPNLPTLPKTSNVTNMGNSIGEVHNTITFAIDRVLDYNDLVTQMQKDGKFERMIEDMTIGKLAGKSSLAKNSYKWT